MVQYAYVFTTISRNRNCLTALDHPFCFVCVRCKRAYCAVRSTAWDACRYASMIKGYVSHDLETLDNASCPMQLKNIGTARSFAVLYTAQLYLGDVWVAVLVSLVPQASVKAFTIPLLFLLLSTRNGRPRAASHVAALSDPYQLCAMVGTNGHTYLCLELCVLVASHANFALCLRLHASPCFEGMDTYEQ